MTAYFDALADLQTRNKIKQQMTNTLFDYDKYFGKSTFKAEVLSGCEQGHQRQDSTDPNNLFHPVVLRVLDHTDSCIPDPTNAGNLAPLYTGAHPIAYSNRPYNKKLGFVPRAGQIVDCYYEDPINRRGLTYIYPQEDLMEKEGFCDSINARDAMNNGAQILGNVKKANNWPEMESVFNSLQATESIVPGAGFNGVVEESKQAIANWKSGSLNEESAEAKPFLTDYWNNLGMDPDNAIQQGYAWSAAFVSYMVRSDSSFPKSSKHFYYTRDSLFNRTQGKTSGWLAYRLGKDKISVKVGDIFVRNTNEDTNGHGDIVYKIDGNKAYMIGGNVYSKEGGSKSTSHGVSAKQVRTVIDIKSVEQATGGYGNYKYIVKKV